jgi:hypothetical protein
LRVPLIMVPDRYQLPEMDHVIRRLLQLTAMIV